MIEEYIESLYWKVGFNNHSNYSINIGLLSKLSDTYIEDTFSSYNIHEISTIYNEIIGDYIPDLECMMFEIMDEQAKIRILSLISAYEDEIVNKGGRSLHNEIKWRFINK